jgi:hypothetical protein
MRITSTITIINNKNTNIVRRENLPLRLLVLNGRNLWALNAVLFVGADCKMWEWPTPMVPKVNISLFPKLLPIPSSRPCEKYLYVLHEGAGCLYVIWLTCNVDWRCVCATILDITGWDYFSPYKNSHIFMINSMFNRVALLKSPLPQLNVKLVS